jgi:tRNA(Ile)-lysidine synthase
MNAASRRDGGTDGVFPDSELRAIFAGWSAYPSIALAVSGGADSVSLMLLVRMWLDLTQAACPQITVLTVDHGLRDASAAEAEWVKSIAGALGFRHETLRWDGEKPSADLQAEARRARYALLTGYCREANVPALATAHTSDDQAETVLMRVARGSGVDGLSAMDGVSRRNGIDILRPFLGIPRRRIEAFLRAHGQPWLDDPSNEDDRFERVRVRRMLRAAPSLGLAPAALALSARRLRRARDALDAAATEFLAANASLYPAGYADIGLPQLFHVPEEIGLRALGRTVTVIGGGTGVPLRLSKLEACFEALRNGRRGATLGGCRLLAKADRLLVIREIGRMSRIPAQPVRPGETTIWDGRFTISYAPDEAHPALLRTLDHEGYRAIRAANGHFGKTPGVAALTLPSLWTGATLRYAAFASFAGPPPAGWSTNSRAEFANSLGTLAGQIEQCDEN